MTAGSARVQLFRYAIVGFVSNGLLYLFYIALTRIGIEPKLAMTLSFGIGVAYTFVMNRRWTFGQRGRGPATYARYGVAYGVAYLLNLGLLALLVDVLGYRHQIVQGLLVLGIAVLLFLAQKFWVFREPAPTMEARPRTTNQ